MTYATALLIKKMAVDYGPALLTLISALLKAEKDKESKEEFAKLIVKKIKESSK